MRRTCRNRDRGLRVGSWTCGGLRHGHTAPRQRSGSKSATILPRLCDTRFVAIRARSNVRGPRFSRKLLQPVAMLLDSTGEALGVFRQAVHENIIRTRVLIVKSGRRDGPPVKVRYRVPNHPRVKSKRLLPSKVVFQTELQSVLVASSMRSSPPFLAADRTELTRRTDSARLGMVDYKAS